MKFGLFRGCLLVLAVQLPVLAFDAAARGRSAEAALALLVLGLSVVWPGVSFHRAAVGDFRGHGARWSLLLAILGDGLCLSAALVTGVWWWVGIGSLLLLSALAGSIWRQGSLSRGMVAVFLPGVLCIGLPGVRGTVAAGLLTEFCVSSVSHVSRLAGVLHAVEGEQLLSGGAPLSGAVLQRGAASLPLWLVACTAAALIQHRSTAVLLLHQLLALGLWAVLMMGRGAVLLAWPAVRGVRDDTLLWLQPLELLFAFAGVGLWLSGDCLTRFLTSPAGWCGALPDDCRRLNPVTGFWNRLVTGGRMSPGMQLRVDGAHRGRRTRRSVEHRATAVRGNE